MIKRTPLLVWIVCATFLFMQYIICMNVYIMGDDYMYATFTHPGILSSVFLYYNTGNGRWLVNIMDSLCLSFDRYLYVIFNPWLLLLLGFLLYQFISLITGEKKPVVFAVSLISISVVNILMTCEVFYWITGAMNYLVPALLMLASMIAVIRMVEGDLSKRRRIACSLMCILSCLTMEQYGLMTIGWMLLVWGFESVNRRKLNRSHIAVFLISLLALSSIAFAPANFIRLDAAATRGASIVTKVIDLIYYDYYSVASSTLVFIIAAYCGYKHYCEKRIKLAVISWANAVILLFVFDYKIIVFRDGVLLILALFSILMSLVTIVPYVVSLYKKRIYIIALIAIEIGSQIMLLRTDLWGFRTSFAWILLYLITILSLFSDNADMNNFVVFASISCAALNPLMGITGVLMLIVIGLNKKTIQPLAIIASILVIIVGLSDEMLGYRTNSTIHEQNIAVAQSANQYSEIEIQDYIDEQYGWSSPPFSSFHESYFRKYYGIPEEVLISYAEK